MNKSRVESNSASAAVLVLVDVGIKEEIDKLPADGLGRGIGSRESNVGPRWTLMLGEGVGLFVDGGVPTTE